MDYETGSLIRIGEEIEGEITQKMKSRGVRAANELKSASMQVLRGQRHGRTYNVPGTGRMRYYKRSKTATVTFKKYRASAPGESPAVRLGTFRLGWQPRSYAQMVGSNFKVFSVVENNTKVGRHLLGEILEDGTRRMAPRPYADKIRQKALPKIKNIYREPFNL